MLAASRACRGPKGYLSLSVPVDKPLHFRFDVSAGSDSSPALIPDHDLLRRIGRGSYGEVWLARNAVGTPRAIKIVRRHHFEHAAEFEREFKGLQCFEPVSRTHQGLSDILALGRLPGSEGFFYVMELADDASVSSTLCESEGGSTPVTPIGQKPECGTLSLDNYSPLTLRSVLRRQTPIEFNRLLDLALKLTGAVAHLHARGLVHRDIKPSNILFIGGEPQLADPGLVTPVDDARSLVGTAGYIAPEGPGTPQADLYALGKVLYESAFGRDRQDFPKLPPDLAKSPNHRELIELNEIIVKACAHDPNDRYESATALQADLEMLRHGGSVIHKKAFRRRLAFLKKAAAFFAVVGFIAAGGGFVSRILNNESVPPKLSANPEATGLYNLGRSFYRKNTGTNLVRAIFFYERAVEKDPKFAAAHAALASSYCWSLGDFVRDFDKARLHAQTALALDNEQAEAHKALAWIKCFGDWDPPESEKEFKRALKLASKDPTIHEWYGVYLRAMGRFEDSITHLREAETLDPLSLSIPALLAFTYFSSGQDDLAKKELEKVITMETNSPSIAYELLAEIHENRGEFLDAITLNERWERLVAEDPKRLIQKYGSLREAAHKGTKGYWLEKLHWAETTASDPIRLASIYIRLGETNRAFRCLEEAFANDRGGFIANVRSDPVLIGLKLDPRYDALVNKIKWK
jgi:serine/threonine protein kinase